MFWWRRQDMGGGGESATGTRRRNDRRKKCATDFGLILSCSCANDSAIAFPRWTSMGYGAGDVLCGWSSGGGCGIIERPSRQKTTLLFMAARRRQAASGHPVTAWTGAKPLLLTWDAYSPEDAASSEIAGEIVMSCLMKRCLANSEGMVVVDCRNIAIPVISNYAVLHAAYYFQALPQRSRSFCMP